jgi:hypothetical protein
VEGGEEKALWRARMGVEGERDGDVEVGVVVVGVESTLLL